MPAMLDDPTAPAIYRVSGGPPYPTPYGALPPDITPRQVTLRDRTTLATLVPFSAPHQVPHHLAAHLCALLNREIDKGDTYPMQEPLPLAAFAAYWFANFGAVMVLGDIQDAGEVVAMEERGVDWGKECLGSFYVKPNYPGRSSHVCNGGFLVTDAARNRGVGRLMGEGYLEWAPKLGYSYSVFNLVYENNVASLRIWDALGFKRIGRVKGCGNLKSYPDQLIDAIIFGRELGGEGDEYVSEERFDKIRFYLKTGSYPNGADRAEKSRLRSAATHYRLDFGVADGDEEKLMLKGKEVVSDPHKQYEIARNMHAAAHGGINKTTASIAEKYHWVRIKETVSAAIRNCPDCKDTAPKGGAAAASATTHSSARRGPAAAAVAGGTATPPTTTRTTRVTVTAGSDDPADTLPGAAHLAPPPQPNLPQAPMTVAYTTGGVSASDHTADADDDEGYMPVDPQLLSGLQHWNHAHPTLLSHSQAMDLDADADADAEMDIDIGMGFVDAGGAGVEYKQPDARLRAQLEAQIRRGSRGLR